MLAERHRDMGMDLRGATMIRFWLAVLLLLVAWPANAQDDGQWVRKSLRSSCEWWETCRYHYRTVKHYRLPAVRVYGYRHDRDDDDRRRVRSHCPDQYVTKVGEERYGRERAKEAAAQAWAEEVRNQCGVLWMGVGNSRDGTYECVESATGNRNSEKTAGAAGQVLVQCVIRAKPGRAKLEQVNRE